MEIKNKLEEEASRVLDELTNTDPGTDEYKFILGEFALLTSRDIEYKKLALDSEEKARANDLASKKMETDKAERAEVRTLEYKKLDYENKKLEHEKRKLAVDSEEHREARQQDSELKKIQMRDDRIDKISRNVIAVLSFGGSIAACICLAKATFTYEEKGTISSVLGRKILGILLPKP